MEHLVRQTEKINELCAHHVLRGAVNIDKVSFLYII